MTTVGHFTPVSSDPRPELDHHAGLATVLIFFGLLAAGLAFAAYSLTTDISAAGDVAIAWLPYILLGIALLIALGFEFVNGFHDTANAVATVIYTHALPANFAVLWSGLFNFLGVLFSSGAVAFGIISLLPVELILQVGSSAGFAMVFALLIAAIVWNLATWLLGLPASSSHTLIGSIIGVGIANALMHGRDGTSGVDWGQASKVGYSLLLSPLIGFLCAALLLLTLRALVKNQALYREPKGNTPPPWWIRGLLILTCTGVSFAHGSNDGQKGMGLIMLILIGTVPTAYALNRAMPVDRVTQFAAVAHVTEEALLGTGTGAVPADPRQVLSEYVRTRMYDAAVLPALAGMVGDIGRQVKQYGSLARVPMQAISNVRNDMYLTSETIRFLEKDEAVGLDEDTRANLKAFKKNIDDATKFIPLWVKVAVAVALGLGTMVGWKRIVVTVGERIGKSHLTYAQGASAELVAMATIGAADLYGLPVSTTQVLSSGVAGTMVANQSGLQWGTVRNLAMAWVLTLPVAMLLSGSLYWLFATLF
ncbi:inorganic phosphate transporter [Nitrosovibrio sp. Nv17]|uniref:inorganic phosphate transporter n=1 Tax=Nitrosovibrio sp. Nv17 TaxID=1855339 RepID=UPI000908D3C4|nr:inorganic phosphate transporter [Nitrosovibrio sp. Nv17]SFW10716.1 inorganic phosphate transporter, PiT family [Nitrosovibrio sp. Nv17]